MACQEEVRIAYPQTLLFAEKEGEEVLSGYDPHFKLDKEPLSNLILHN